MPIDTLVKLLQFSISPIVLISAASLLLLSITNRLGRTIDRSRTLVRELEGHNDLPFKEDHKDQLQILLRRSRYLRSAVLCISACIFLAAMMTMSLFLLAFAGWPLTYAVLACLFLGVLAICSAVVFLILDVSAGLKALEVEVSRHI